MAKTPVAPARSRRKSPRNAQLATPNVSELAMVAATSGNHPADVAKQVLEAQARLMEAQCAELRLRQFGERIRAAFWAIVAVAAFALLALVVAIVVRASRTNALIVESFDMPPGLQVKGLSGKVVATQVLDKLAEMQAKSESTRAASSYSNDWGDDLKIEIPNTGATAEQLWRLVRGWLGKETRISGEVIETQDGLALTARVGTAAGKRFVGPEPNFDALIMQSAEVIYQETQPYRYTVYLGKDPQRATERFAALQRLTAHPSPDERKWAFNGLSVLLRLRGDFRGSIGMTHRALKLDNKMLPALSNLGSGHGLLGHSQAMIDYYSRMAALPVGKEYDAEHIEALRCGQQASIGISRRDPTQIEDAANCLEASGSSLRFYGAQNRVYASLLRHDYRPALGFRPRASTAAEDEVLGLEFRLRAEMERGPSPALNKALGNYLAVTSRRAAIADTAAFYRANAPIRDWPLEAEAMLILGRTAEAAALIRRTPLDCYTCLRVRGLVAFTVGNRSEGQRWFQEAAKQGPGLAPAFLDWGRLLLAANHFGSAEVKLKEASRLAPNWADPLKIWGDLLAAQGKREQAIAKYNAAIKLAPKWMALRQARARLLSAT